MTDYLLLSLFLGLSFGLNQFVKNWKYRKSAKLYLPEYDCEGGDYNNWQ